MVISTEKRSLKAIAGPKVVDYNTNMPVYAFDPLTGWWGVPGIERHVAFEGPGGPLVHVKLNIQGNRDKPFENRPGLKNILCWGGSHTWGAFVEQERRYTDVLNARLRGCQFVNIGHGSFGLDQICLAILNRSRFYCPSMMVIEQYPWAAHRVLNSYVNGYLKPSFYLDVQGDLKLRKVPRLARYKLYRRVVGSYRLYKKELAEFQGGIDIKDQYDPFVDPIFLYWKSSYYEYMYALLEKILRVIGDHCAQIHCRLIFVMIAYSQQFGHESGSQLIDYELPSKRFKKILEKNRIEYVDTAAALVAAHSASTPVIKPDGHTNERGHALIADVLEKSLKDRGWI
jgi:hypothetical protein